jgi:hypothetical protein
VEHRCQARLPALELDSKQLREEVVEAVPLSSIVERDEEEIRTRERGELRG